MQLLPLVCSCRKYKCWSHTLAIITSPLPQKILMFLRKDLHLWIRWCRRSSRCFRWLSPPPPCGWTCRWWGGGGRREGREGGEMFFFLCLERTAGGICPLLFYSPSTPPEPSPINEHDLVNVKLSASCLFILPPSYRENGKCHSSNILIFSMD